MIVTHSRRWWITRRLYFFTKEKKTVWIDENDFIDSLLKRVDFFSLPYSHFVISNKQESLKSELRDLIDECEEDIKYIKSVRVSKTSGGGTDLAVGAKGLEIYSITYLIFGHSYAKGFWTGIMLIVVGLILKWIFN